MGKTTIKCRKIMLQSTYGECDLEKEKVVGSGWFTEDPREIQQRC